MVRSSIAHPPADLTRHEIRPLPACNLDAGTGADIVRLLRDLNRQDGLTIIMVTHNLDLVTETDRTLRIADGRIEEEPVHAGQKAG